MYKFLARARVIASTKPGAQIGRPPAMIGIKGGTQPVCALRLPADLHDCRFAQGADL